MHMGHRVEVSIVNRRWGWQRHRRTADTCHHVTTPARIVVTPTVHQPPRPHRRRDYHRDHPGPGYHGSAGGGGFDKRRRGSCACVAGCSDVYHQTVGKIVLPVVCVWASRPENWPWPMARQRIFVVDCGVILGFCSFPQPSPLLKPGGFVVGSPVVPNISPFAPKEGHAAPNGDRLALYDRDVRSTTCNGGTLSR